MGRLYSTYHINEESDRSVKLRELKDSGYYSLEIGDHNLIFIGELEDLNDLGFEIMMITDNEREKKKAEIIEAQVDVKVGEEFK